MPSLETVDVRLSLIAAGQVPRLQHDSPPPLVNGHKNLNVQAGLFAGSSATAPGHRPQSVPADFRLAAQMRWRICQHDEKY